MSYINHIISTQNERLTSGFRPPDRPDHTGMDFTDTDRLELKQDVYILAFAGGTVTDTTVGDLIGYNVDIAHEGKILTRYHHMKAGSVRVKPGQKVKKGDILGVMGTTGQSSGIHLHFEIKEGSTKWNNGTSVNPEPYLSGEKSMRIVEPVKPDGEITKNDKVKVLNAVTYSGKPFRAWFDVYEVLQVDGDRVVIGIGDIVTAAVRSADLLKV